VHVEKAMRGFLSILEACRSHAVEHVVFGSSDREGVSLEAILKRTNELLAHSYSQMFGIPTTGVRFSGVYGPWGHPEMTVVQLTRSILENRPIDVVDQGLMVRDFTYVDDIVESVVRIVDKPATPSHASDGSAPEPAASKAPYRVFNIGNMRPAPLMEYVRALESTIGREARKIEVREGTSEFKVMAGDLPDLEAWVGSTPSTPVEVGVQRFYEWYREHQALAA